jgi:hypothetical protein
MPTHLVILQHGLHGRPTDFQHICSKINEQYRDKYLIHPATSNASILKTQDGIANAGNRLFSEILQVISNYENELERISIIGHSLGGLIARFAIGKLFACGVFEKLIPTYFVSITVPNVGSRRPPRSYWNKVVSVVTSTMLQQTGKELMLEDSTLVGVPLLVLLAQKDTIFMKGLAAFKTRILYSNIRNDLQVPYCTAAIVHKNPYLYGSKEMKCSSKYPHIIDTGEECGLALDLNESNSVHKLEKEIFDNLFINDSKGDHLRSILYSLQTLSWRRYDVLFDNWLSHTHVVMKSKWINSVGVDVIQHIVDNLTP